MKIIKKIIIIELIFIIFQIGRLYGIYENKNIKDERITKAYIELEDEKEKNYRLQVENNRLNTILNNYTIEERKMK